METEQLLPSSETFSSNEQLSDALAIVEGLTPQGRRELFADPTYFPLFFAYYFPEYIKYPFADFHFRMFADTGRPLRGDIRELAWIMFRESTKTSIAIYNPRVDITTDTKTLYASDRDVFIFLVDDLNPIEAGRLSDGSPDLYFRGFYCWNSDVGAKTLGMASFYLRAVCQNRNLWGVEDFEEIATRRGVNPDGYCNSKDRPVVLARHPLQQAGAQPVERAARGVRIAGAARHLCRRRHDVGATHGVHCVERPRASGTGLGRDQGRLVKGAVPDPAHAHRDYGARVGQAGRLRRRRGLRGRRRRHHAGAAAPDR